MLFCSPRLEFALPPPGSRSIVVRSETWDSTAYKLFGQNKDIVFVPPATGALTWIDTFTIPRKGKADDAAYKWINFVMQPEIATMIAASSGAVICFELILLPQCLLVQTSSSISMVHAFSTGRSLVTASHSSLSWSFLTEAQPPAPPCLLSCSAVLSR